MAKKSPRSWPVGKRVRFKPNAVSLAMYSAAPAPGTMGKVVAVSLGSKKATYLPGPGGGLVYVDWDTIGVMGVSPIDLEPVKIGKRTTPTSSASAKLPSTGWGQSYGGISYVTREGIQVWMFRKGQKVRFYDAAGRQFGSEQSNVAPAVAAAMSAGWREVSEPTWQPNPATRKMLSDSNPVLTAAERRVLPTSAFADPKNRRFPIHDMEHARAAVGKLNLWYKRGKISKDEYKEYYQRMMKAYSKFGMTAQKPPLVQVPRVISGKKKTSGAKPELKVAVGQNPARKPTSFEAKHLESILTLNSKKEVLVASETINHFYFKGKIKPQDYQYLYKKIANAWGKLGGSGELPNVVDLDMKPGENPSKRHLPVLQPYSPEWRKRRQANIASQNPAAKVARNDPSAVRAIMMKVMAQPNPVADKGGPQMAMKISAAEIGLEASRAGKNVSSLSPMEYYDVFLEQGKDPDAAMATLEDMAAWGVTDEI